MNYQEIIDRMNYVRKKRGLKLKDIVAKTGLSYRTIQAVFSGQHCNTDSFAKVIQALGLEVNVI